MGKVSKKWKRYLSVLMATAMVFSGSGISELSVSAAEIVESETETAFAEETQETEKQSDEDASEETSKEENVDEEVLSEEISETEITEVEESETTTEKTTVVEESETTTEETTVVEESETTTEETTEVEESETITEETTEVEESETITEETTIENETEEITEEENAPAAENTTGKIVNGDFENGLDSWTVTLSDAEATHTVKSDEWAKNNTTNYLNIWTKNGSCDVKIIQTMSGIEPGTYKVSLRHDGDLAGGLSLYARKGETQLTAKELGTSAGWDVWTNIETDSFKVESASDEITIEISGAMQDAGKYIDIDDIVLTKVEDTSDDKENTSVGNIVNGDFESGLDSWTVTLSDAEATHTVKSDEWANNNTTNYLNIWTKNGSCDVKIIQTMSGIEPGTYKVSLRHDGDLAGGLSLYAKKGETQLTAKELGISAGWDVWTNVETDSFKVESASDEITIEISGTMQDAGKYIDIDDIVFAAVEDETAKLRPVYEELCTLYDTVKTYKAVKEGTDITTIPENEKNITFIENAEWTTFAALRDVTKTLVEAGIDNLGEKTVDEVYTAITENYNAVFAAAELLKSATIEDADVNADKVPVAPDFITGADLSSYVSLIESGVVFKDENGKPLSDSEFFELIADGGTNWVRIRVWDDPYDSSGNGYGGGNNDIEVAKTIGKLATDAGMKVLIDFHYSDFWVDPSKFDAPKAWQGMDIVTKEKALEEYTYNNLVELYNAGVNVGMVQVGNETNSGIAGERTDENKCILFNAGSRGVRKFSEEKYGDKSKVLVAVHFTDPQDGYAGIASTLDKYKVDYDVFASSYYPVFHENATAEGDTTSLRTALEHVAKTYNKLVMVAETSWPSTWEDGDGHGNGSPSTTHNLQYDISVQGQIDQMRAVVAAVNDVNNGIGVFYWEPAWVPVGYAYNDDGSLNEAKLAENKKLWEKYGSGWASSYAAEYDPDDAGKWYGGSSMDNQSWFDFDGTALPSVNTYRYIKNGAETEKKISGVDKNIELNVYIGDTLEFPSTVTAKFNDGTTAEYAVEWDKEQKSLVSTDAAGQYTVDGLVICTYDNGTGTSITEKYEVILTIKVHQTETSNQLVNPGFEIVENDTASGWNIVYGNDDGTYTVKPTGENPRTGSYGLNFYKSGKDLSVKVSQEITGLDTGLYDFGGYIQGGGVGADDYSYAYVTIYTVDDKNVKTEKITYKSSCQFEGWLNWKNPEIKGFAVQKGEVVEVGFELKSSVEGTWGSIDDAYLYGTYGVTVDSELANAQISLGNSTAKVGEKINFTVIPNEGYILEKVMTYTLGANGEKTEVNSGLVLNGTDGYFFMPAFPVYITATVKAVSEITEKVDISKDVVFETIKRQIKTGGAIEPEITATYKSYTLVKDTDYTVEYSNNTETGTATILVKGNGVFTGEKTLSFDIVEVKKIEDADIKVADGAKLEFTYTGEKIEPVVTVDGKDVTQTEDFVVEYINNIKAGTATIHVVANENNAVYTGSVKYTFKIVKANLKTLENDGKITVSKPAGSTYTGNAVKPNITIKYGNKNLKKGTDYTVTYKKNKVVTESAEIIIKGKGAFTGTLTKIFAIKSKSLTSVGVTATTATLVESNSPLKISATVKVSDTKLKYGRDYEISKVIDATGVEVTPESNGKYKLTKGKYTVTLKGNGNYSGEINVALNVTDINHSIEKAKINVGKADFAGRAVKLTGITETGAVPRNSIRVTAKDGKVLIENTDYKLTYEDNIKSGSKAKVTVTGIGEYAGAKTVKFTIDKADLSKLIIQADIKPDENNSTAQYYTGYALAPEYNITAVIGDNKVTMINGVDYTIKFKNNVTGKLSGDGKYMASATITGKGNFKGKYTNITFEVIPTKLSDFDVSIATVTYDGKAQKPEPVFVYKKTGVTMKLKSGVAYKAKYTNNKTVANINAQKAPTAVITEKGLGYSDKEHAKESITVNFNITNEKINASNIKNISIQNYKKGKAVTPKAVVKVNGRTLKLNKDYKVIYKNNTLRGKAYITVTGIGNYSGTVTKAFTIK